MALVAHEVRTPLAVAKNAATTLLTSRGGEQQTELLEMIARNIDLAVLLLDRVGLARSIEHGDVRLSTKVIDLAHLVRQSADDLTDVILGDHPVELTAAEELMVEADPTAAREIVFNLLSNAAKYSRQGSPIEVAVHEHRGHARVVVRDYGVGVTSGDAEVIFDKFFQADSGSPGVGLGLFISRGFARAHGGDLTVRAPAREGSEFVLDLPLHV